MIKHLDHPLRVARLALLVNVSASHYFALFKRLTGRTPIDVFIRLRMSRACQLLDSTSMEVKEVAAALGYEDPFYFSRLFKSVNQVAPSEYRTLSNERRSCIRRATIPNSLSATADRESGVVDGRHSPQKP
jgi:transcriptional regulator GlxA family with amidase domain